MLIWNPRLAPETVLRTSCLGNRGRTSCIMRGVLFQGSRCDWNVSAAPGLVVFKCGATQYTVVKNDRTLVLSWLQKCPRRKLVAAVSANFYPGNSSSWSCGGLWCAESRRDSPLMAVSARSIACWAPSKMGREAWVQIYNYLALKLNECHDRAVGWAGPEWDLRSVTIHYWKLSTWCTCKYQWPP